MASAADRCPTQPYQDQLTCTHHGAIPGTVYHVSGTRSEENEDPAPSKDLLSLWIFFFLPSVTPAPPLSIKGKAGHPIKGMDRFHTHHTTQLSSIQALSTLSSFPSETWDLSLSRPFVPPITNLSVLITRAAAD